MSGGMFCTTVTSPRLGASRVVAARAVGPTDGARRATARRQSGRRPHPIQPHTRVASSFGVAGIKGRVRRGVRVSGAGGEAREGSSSDAVKTQTAVSAAQTDDDDDLGVAEDEGSVAVETVPPVQFLLTSTAFYVAMGVGSQVGASALGVHPDVLDGMRACNVDAASAWTIPLLASLAFAITQADEYEFLSEVRDIFKVGVLPSLAPLGLGGCVALALGAGIGEEAFFRGFLMPFADGLLTNAGVPEAASSAGVLAATSVFFGALHAITPAYAIWATGAGLLFGVEYMRDGLGTAAFTHTLYDFLAFGFILVSWPIEGYEKELPFQGNKGK